MCLNAICNMVKNKSNMYGTQCNGISHSHVGILSLYDIFVVFMCIFICIVCVPFILVRIRLI